VLVLVTVGTGISIYVVDQIVERRGRSYK